MNKKEFLSKVDLTKELNIGLLYFLSYCSNGKCFMCNYRPPSGILSKKNAKKFTPLVNMFTGEFLFHLYSSHGICPESFNDIIHKAIANYEPKTKIKKRS